MNRTLGFLVSAAGRIEQQKANAAKMKKRRNMGIPGWWRGWDGLQRTVFYAARPPPSRYPAHFTKKYYNEIWYSICSLASPSDPICQFGPRHTMVTSRHNSPAARLLLTQASPTPKLPVPNTKLALMFSAFHAPKKFATSSHSHTYEIPH